jgi:predicted nucleotidyltransferase
MKLQELLARLADAGVRFSVIGGVALVARGVQRATEDLDIAYARDRENLARLAEALRPLHPRLRGVPEGLPFTLDAASLRAGLNFTLDTDLGPLDLLGEVPGLGTFEHVDAASSEIQLEGMRVLALTVEGLERAKRAAGRPKDLLDLGYLRALAQTKR